MSEKSRLERVFASVPQGRTAGVVTARGTHYEPDLSGNGRRLCENQPPVRSLSTLGVPERALVADLPGRRFGRLVVIGLSSEPRSFGGARWVVRCTCGRFEFRRAKVIRTADPTDCCKECDHLRHIKAQYEKLGSRSVQELVEIGAAKVAR